MPTPSLLRARLTSFDRAYAVAIRLREATGRDQYIVRTGEPLQPLRVTAMRPADPDATLAWCL